MFLIYTRVSSTEQAHELASSLPDQERKSKALAVARGAGPYDMVVYSDEGVSGSIPLILRPEGARMMADAKEGDCIIAIKTDRMFRSVLDAYQTAEVLKKLHVDLILADLSTEPVTGRGTGKIMFGMMAVFAEFERERIADRTMEGRLAKQAKRGSTGGPPPFGFHVIGHGRDAKIEPHPTEFEHLTTIRKLWHEHTPASAAKEAERLGIRSRAGTPLQINQIQRIAEREARV